MYKKNNFVFENVNSVTITGGVVHPYFKKMLEKIFPNTLIIDMYGQTELGVISLIDNTSWLDSEFCVGSISFFNKVKINKLGYLTQFNKEIGEIQVKSHYAYKGYIGKKTYEEDYVRTGDIGYIEEDKLFYMGRYSDKIIINDIVYFVRELESSLFNEFNELNFAVFVEENKFFVYVTDKYKQVRYFLEKNNPILVNNIEVHVKENIYYTNQKPSFKKNKLKF